jgi:PAS domain S-box-containing protein
MTIPSTLEQPVDTIGAIARCRYLVLKRADELLGEMPEAVDDQANRLSGVSGLLMTSLEELKVAEEELRLQNTVLESQRAAVDERLRHYRQLFLYLPTPAFVTDVYATIREANLAAASLFRREAAHLERKPLATLLANEYREEFRRQLGRATAGDGVRDWRLVVKRVGDVPVEVHATVARIPGIGPTDTGLMYWLLTPRTSDD